jgi:Na+/proline symporter
MRKGIITVVSIVCCFAALFGIKMMDLPGLVTALLVIIDILFVMFIIIYASGNNKTEAGK